jgi:hypothetical protein
MNALDPRWLTSTVVDLAQTIYDLRAYESLPVLADALEDAGCDDRELIVYLRTRDEKWLQLLDCFAAFWEGKYERPLQADDVLYWLSRCSRMPKDVDQSLEMIKNWAVKIGSPGWYDDVETDREDATPQRLVRWAAEYRRSGDYVHMGANMDYQDYWDRMEEFWRSYEDLTGEKVEDATQSFFSCAC